MSDFLPSIPAATTARERTAPSPSRTQDTQSCAAVATVDVGDRLEENPDTGEGAPGVKKRHRSSKCARCTSPSRAISRSTIAQSAPMGSNAFDAMEEWILAIWHSDWNNGNDVPQLLLQEHKMRDRPPASRPGKNGARRQQAREEEDVNAEDDAAETSEDVNASPSIGGEGTVAEL
ncbi:hypothetical protein PHMEG_00024283 [Phytophthora megakarya]|uniref:Uncharacterized protein n=1 Tax=Phytophthora megakarya TaxID=4795 RepID=A0A225VG30_9STRA|nr:hypothetical protein PHMEG_00024283 [Phytophthora megakarya]